LQRKWQQSRLLRLSDSAVMTLINFRSSLPISIECWFLFNKYHFKAQSLPHFVRMRQIRSATNCRRLHR
jgi:hypothetical protein